MTQNKEYLSLGMAAFVVAILWAVSVMATPWSAGAQGTDATGNVIVGPPPPGQAVEINIEHGIVNVNPLDGDPYVQIGDVEAITTADDGNGTYRGVFGFTAAHIAFKYGGSVSLASQFVFNKWNNTGIDASDITVKCLNSNAQFTSGNVTDIVVTVLPNGNDYTYEISGIVRQDGTCLVMFRNSAELDRPIENLDLAPAGVGG